jgi:hypothetical protein
MLSLIDTITQWLREHSWVAWLMMGLSVTTLLATFVLVPWIIVRIPQDYFARQRATQMPWEKLHPGLRIAVLAIKNILGVLLVLAGIVLAMPLVPGPGVFTILVGLGLLDLPGKRSLERWIVKQPTVFAAANKLRFKYGRTPLDKPE